MAKDYYKILGISDEEKKLHGDEFLKVLKPKFRKLSIENHPDKFSNASEDVRKKHEEKFKEIAEAYDVLGDETKRQQYDMGGDNFHWGGFGFDPFEMFRQHFGSGFDDFGFGGFRTQNVPVGTDIRIKVNITLKESLEGGTKKVQFKRGKQCNDCKRKTCAKCNGTGVSVNMQRFGNQVITTQTECPHCHGRGFVNECHCGKCNDTGILYETVTELIEIPKGVDTNMAISIKGKGNEPIRKDNNSQFMNGNLIVIFNVLDDERFERDGNDLITTVDLSLIEAWQGCEIKVDTLEGASIGVKIPKLTENGKMFRLKEKGMPIMANPTIRGNMYLKIQYEIPKKELTKKQIELLKEFYKIEKGK